MSVEEMDNMFEVLYNNITSDQAPGLNAYEKSVFLTKAQDEILKNYFNPKSKGNNLQEGFDGNPKRQVDFSMLTTVYKIEETLSVLPGTGGLTPTSETSQENTKAVNITEDTSGTLAGGSSIALTFGSPLFDIRDNTKSVSLPPDIMMAINEMVGVTRDKSQVLLQVVPIKFDEYTRLMSKPYKRPLKYQAWRLINSNKANIADLIVGPSDAITKYILRYIRRPKPIIVSDLDGLTIENKGEASECELDPILHEEILQRAVELAKAAWTSTGQDNLQAVFQTGQRSE